MSGVGTKGAGEGEDKEGAAATAVDTARGEGRQKDAEGVEREEEAMGAAGAAGTEAPKELGGSLMQLRGAANQKR